MKRTVSKSDFIDAFRVADRLENFSYEARELLFDYFEEYEGDAGKEIELDVIAICCEYSEDSPEGIAENYDIDVSDCEGDEDKIKGVVLEYLAENTYVVGEIPHGIVYVTF